LPARVSSSAGQLEFAASGNPTGRLFKRISRDIVAVALLVVSAPRRKPAAEGSTVQIAMVHSGLASGNWSQGELLPWIRVALRASGMTASLDSPNGAPQRASR
jgi:hypothetical protein